MPIGEWILVDRVIETFYKCSICGFEHQMDETQYCPGRGNLMRIHFDFGSILDKIYKDPTE